MTRNVILSLTILCFVASAIAIGLPPRSIVITAIVGGVAAALLAVRARRRGWARSLIVALFVASYTVAALHSSQGMPFGTQVLRLVQGASLALFTFSLLILVLHESRGVPPGSRTGR